MFMRFYLVQFGLKNNKLVMIIGQLGTSTVFNTLKVSEKQRAGIILKEYVFNNLKDLVECGDKCGAKYIAIIFAYGYKNFLEEYALTKVETLAFVSSIEDSRKFLMQEISQEEFLKKEATEILIYEFGGTFKKIELSLE